MCDPQVENYCLRHWSGQVERGPWTTWEEKPLSSHCGFFVQCQTCTSLASLRGRHQRDQPIGVVLVASVMGEFSVLPRSLQI